MDKGNAIFALATAAVILVLPICCLVVHRFRQAKRQRGGHEVDQGGARSINSASMEVFSGTASPDISSVSSEVVSAGTISPDDISSVCSTETFTIAIGLCPSTTSPLPVIAEPGSSGGGDDDSLYSFMYFHHSCDEVEVWV